MSISSVSGATLAVSTGIWVEDSVILIKDSETDYSDNGVYVRHISEGFTTRPTLENVTISNSKYRGMMVEQYNRSKWNELSVNAIIRNTTIIGTGGPFAQTPGLGLSGLELNTSGAIIDGLELLENHAPGLKAYMIDGSSTFQNVTSEAMAHEPSRSVPLMPLGYTSECELARKTRRHQRRRIRRIGDTSVEGRRDWDQLVRKDQGALA